MSRILLVHGWGFDPALWAPLRAALPDHACTALDLGYFGPARLELPAAPDLVVGHSFGCLWALAHPELAGLPLVAVNGFLRFTAGPDCPHGTPRRILDRMLTRLQEDPRAVLQAFHARLGTAVPRMPPGGPDLARLDADLRRMRDLDLRGRPGPVLACAAADDPLVAPALALQAFGPALRMLAAGGHALPLTRPGLLAGLIRTELGR